MECSSVLNASFEKKYNIFPICMNPEIKFPISIFARYIPDVTGAVYTVLREMAESHVSKKKRYEDNDAEILRKVSARLITKETLREKLAQHVEQVSYQTCMVLAYKKKNGA